MRNDISHSRKSEGIERVGKKIKATICVNSVSVC